MMGLVGILATIIVAGIVWLVQEIRMKKALQQQRKDLRADFRADLKEILLTNTKNVFSWVQEQPVKQIDPELEARFAGAAETTATAWFSGGGIPSNAFIITPDDEDKTTERG